MIASKNKVGFFTKSELMWHENIDYKIDRERTLSFNRDKVTMFTNGVDNIVNEADYFSDLVTDATYAKYSIVPSDYMLMTIIFKLGICSVSDIRNIGNYLNNLYNKVMVTENFEARITNLCKCGLAFCYTFKDIYGTKKELFSLTRSGNSVVYHQNPKLNEDGIFSLRYDDDFSFYCLFETLKYAEASKAMSILIKYHDSGVKYKVNSTYFDKVKRKNYRTYGFYNATIGDEEKYILIEPWKTSYPEGTFVNSSQKGDFISYEDYANNRIDVIKKIIRTQPTRQLDGTNDNFKIMFVCEDQASMEDLVERLKEQFDDDEKETVLITSSYLLSAVNILKNPVFYRYNDDKLENCPFFIDFVNKVL